MVKKIFAALLFFFLAINLTSAQESAAPAEPPPPGPPSAPISPLDSAKTVQLDKDSILELKWQPVAGATAYFYQYWEENAPAPSPELRASTNRSELAPLSEIQPGQTLLAPGAKYFWHVRSCLADNCGSYGDSWSFIFLLDPPQLVSPVNGGTVGLPATLEEWQSVNGARAYNGLFYLGNKCHPFLAGLEAGKCEPFTLGPESNFEDELCFFSKGGNYQWEMASCLDKRGTTASCGGYGPRSSFRTNLNFALEKAAPTSPLYSAALPEQILPPVNLADQLAWLGSFCAYSYRIEIQKEGQKFFGFATDTSSVSLAASEMKPLWAKPENFDKVYSWKVDPCWDLKGKDNQCQNDWSQPWFFKTTGAKPVNLDTEVGALTKLSWSWSKDTKAASYRYQVATNQNFSPGTIVKNEKAEFLTATLQFPDILPEKNYWWRVKSCADPTGDLCGEWSETKTFTIPRLEPPTNLKPSGGGKIFMAPERFTVNPSPVAPYYQWEIDFTAASAEEKRSNAPVGQQILKTITDTNSVSLPSNYLGDYRLAVRACLEKTCSEPAPAVSAWTAPQVFTQVAAPTPPFAGLVPCGRRNYPHDEPCQLKHLVIALQNIIDFLLWRLGLIILGIFSVVSGAIFYFSLGGPTTLVRIKSLWKSIGLGYGLMLIAWTIVNLIMTLAGFQSQFFGRWFKLPF